MPSSALKIEDNNGTVSTGSISGMTVTTNKGAIVAAGHGTMTDLTIGTNDGSFLSSEDTTAGSVSTPSLHDALPICTVSTGSISGMTVTTNKGAIVAAGQGTMTDLTIG